MGVSGWGLILWALLGQTAAPDAAEWTRRLAAHPELADGIRLARGQARLAAGDRAGARADAEAVFAAAPPWQAEAAWLRAQASERCAETLHWIERAPAQPGAIPAADRLALWATAARACGDQAAAATAERTLVTDWPWTPVANQVAARVALDTAGVLAQAAAWEGHRDYGQARRLLEGLADHPEVGARARFEVARLALDRERVNFVGAARAFEALAAEGGPRAVEAASEAARAWGRAGELDRAVAGYEALAAAHPDDPKAGSARFFAGFLRYEAGDYPAAVRAWTEARGRLGGFEDAARWYVAWSKYLAGDPAAGAALRALANPEGDRAERRAAYWAVRALGSQDPAGAAALAVRLVSHEPLGWYALLLRRRYPEIFPAPLSPPPSPDPNAQVPGLQRARALQAVGLPRLARLALAAEVPALRRAGESAALRAAAVALGAPNLAMLDALQVGQADLARWPDSGEAAATWRAAWPLGFVEPVTQAARAAGVSRWWIHSFIRKESAYRPEVVSRAHAVGLMQLIEPTLRGIVAAGGPQVRDAFDPAENIAAGSWYVGALSRRFGGQLPLVAAAYNGGPGAVVQWMGGRAEAPTDEFVDRIPYKEARGYVRRMVETVVHYRMLHEGVSLEAALSDLPLTLDLRVAAGVDF